MGLISRVSSRTYRNFYPPTRMTQNVIFSSNENKFILLQNNTGDVVKLEKEMYDITDPNLLLNLTNAKNIQQLKVLHENDIWSTHEIFINDDSLNKITQTKLILP